MTTAPPNLEDAFALPSTNGHAERTAKKEALKIAISGAAAVETLKLGLEPLEDIDSPTERFAALQNLKAETGLTNGKAFEQAVATLIDEQRNDKDCTLAELMQREHDATWGIDQFAAKGALVGIGGDKGTLGIKVRIAAQHQEEEPWVRAALLANQPLVLRCKRGERVAESVRNSVAWNASPLGAFALDGDAMRW